MTEKRYIMPYKVIVAKEGAIDKRYEFGEELKTIDIIYMVDKKSTLFIKNKPISAVVNENLEELRSCQNKDAVLKLLKQINYVFSLSLLEKLKLINNSIIINYEEYIKGAKQ